MRRLLVVAMVAMLPTAILAQDAGPVAAWDFNGSFRKLARDITGNSHHAAASTDIALVDSPGGKAAVFNGGDTCYRAKGHPDLVMSDQVTVDVWLMVDDTTRTEPGCVVDKGGERYRIQVTGATPMFGLKGDDGRMDLTTGQLTQGVWHRVTGVFDRPHASLYIDGELVGQKDWDHAIGPGGDLNIGSKAGTVYMFKGKIDELRIYDYPRPPRADDTLSTNIPGVGQVKPVDAKLEVTKIDGGTRVDTGAAVFEFTDAGSIRSIVIGHEAAVADNDAPLLAASVFESADYNGYDDFAAGKTVAGTWRAARHDFQQDADSFTASWTGSLDFPGGDALDCSYKLAGEKGSAFLTATVSLTPRGDFHNRFLRSAEMRLPLALNKRKRVVQAGDRGMQWDTRHLYQFHINTRQRLMAEAGHNIWRHFAIDQNTAGDYQIWRSESTCTAPLSMQRGLHAPGWMAAYDQRVGLLFAYRGFADRTPKSLRVEADGSGIARVCFWHEGLPALDFKSPQAAAVFGAPHQTDWLVFDDDFTFAQPDVALAARWETGPLASDPPARNEIPLADLHVLTAPSADDAAPLVTGGVPIPRGALTDPANVRLRRDGRDVPLQTKVTGWWPDHSIKWLLLTFPADGGEVAGASGEGDSIVFNLTRRDADPVRYRFDFGGDAAMGVPQTALQAARSGDTVAIDTGPLQLEVAQDAQWLRQVKLDGRNLLSGGATSFVDFLRADNDYPTGTTHGQGRLDPGQFVPESIELEEAGPLRATVRLEGYTTSEEPTRIIIRLEAYAGRSVVRVFQSAEFLQKDVRLAYVRRMGVDLPLVGMAAATVTAGGQDGPVALTDCVRAGLKQHSHLGYTAWRQMQGERFLRDEEIKNRAQGWLDMSSATGGVTIMMRNMWQQFPDELVADTRASHLRACFWPESGPVMDVRRYSNYPHLSQGESVSSDSSWVETNYYDRQQFVGITKTHEILLYFHGADTTSDRIASINADFQRPPLVHCDPAWYISTEVAPPQPIPGQKGFARIEANLNHYTHFWMHHQKLWGWYGLWDYGDVQHHYKGGYGWIVPAKQLTELVKDGVPDDNTVDVRRLSVCDYAPNHEWCFDNGRWGWGNTEGLPGMYMQQQYLRTGDRDLYFFAEAMARHERDVDMRHDGDWLGKGTRHGVQHWSDGNHEERQTTHSEFRYIYQLSGDMRSYDTAKLLYDRVYSQADVSIHAAHSGRWQGLLTWWEMTGSDEVGAILAKYADCFVVPEGLCMSPSVSFPEVKCNSQTRDVNSGSMFFWTFGAAHGMVEYYNLTGHAGIKRGFIKVADLILNGESVGVQQLAVIFAARNADDPAPYRQWLRDYAATHDMLVQIVPHNPDFYAGPKGMLRGSVSGAWFFMNDVTYLMTALDGDPQKTDAQWADIARVDQEGGPMTAQPQLSWQSEYDTPELAEYLRIHHPQP